MIDFRLCFFRHETYIVRGNLGSLLIHDLNKENKLFPSIVQPAITDGQYSHLSDNFSFVPNIIVSTFTVFFTYIF